MKKILIIAALSILILAPLLAKLTSDFMKPDSIVAPQTEVTPATKADITDALRRKNDTLSDSEKFSTDFTVTDFKKITSWWYIAKININGRSESLILSKFTDSKNATTVVTLPGFGVAYYNISGSLGIPYEVVDEYNKNWSGDDE